MSTANLQQRLNDLFGYIRQGKIIEATNEFYDKDIVMQENANPPTKGLGSNIEREKQAIRILMKTVAFLVLITAVVTYAQMPASRKSKSDPEEIASALQAGPK